MSNNNDNTPENQENQQSQGGPQNLNIQVPTPQNSQRQSREGTPDGSQINEYAQFENAEAGDEALQKLIAAQVNKAVEALVAVELPVSHRRENQKRLEESKGNWPEVLPGVLWAYRTMAKTSTGETPFLLVYGTEALIPVEIGEPSTRFIQATQESNDEEMRVNLDLLEARRKAALIRMAAQK
uniref:Uncharacterized protein n=1 Tax=Nicotiana tabacum TaxID=4097 RepID=A0A1S3ZUK7_TOBAC|nr:PREDICTED: uncharacterized protein LOC107790664 [Nicotiana tabacum]